MRIVHIVPVFRAKMDQIPISRRGILRSAAFVFASWLWERPVFAAHFWDSKPASQWSPEEITEMITNSPWAKQVSAQYRAAMDDPRIQPGAPLVQRPGEQQAGECGLVPCSNVMPGKVVVIWESAQPIQEAIHPKNQTEMNGRYVISVRGLAGDYTVDSLKAGSELSAKGKPPLQPGEVMRRNNTWLFGFSKELLALGPEDKDVQFAVRVGARLTNTLVRASFNLKDMIYRGQLAL